MVRTRAVMRPSSPAILALVVAALLLSGCETMTHLASLATSKIGATTPARLHSIPDAIPKVEPLCKYGNMPSYTVRGKRYEPMRSAVGFTEEGIASWYGPNFDGKPTSCMERYDMYAMTAAHKTLPLPSYVEVTNKDNGRSVVVRVNDRGPFHQGRIIDLSYTAAWKLDLIKKGTAPVSIRVITPGKRLPPTTTESTPSPSQNSYIQLGLFSSRENASALKQRLADQIQSIDTMRSALVEIRALQKEGNHLYQLVVEPDTTQTSALALQQQLHQLGIEAVVKKH